MTTIIDIQKLQVSYNQKDLILDGIDLKVNKGEAVALLGHNGSGKSTLLKALNGINHIYGGNATILGIDLKTISRSDLRNLRSKIGFIAQNHNLVKRLSVLTNIIHAELGKSSSPRYWFQSLASKSSREQALKQLEAVKLSAFAGKFAGDLSGGQAQRVAIARALNQNPEIILADEPTASLDPQAGKEVMELLHKLCKEHGITLVFTTHDLDHAREFSDRVIALKGGGVEINQATTEINFSDLNYLYE